MNDDKLKITLRIADLKTPLALRVDYGADEKYWRDAADLFNKRWAFYKDKYKDGLMDSVSMMAMVVFSAASRAAVDDMFNELQSREYAVISYEVEAQRGADGIVYRATLVIRAKGNADEDRYIDLLRENPDISVERIV